MHATLTISERLKDLRTERSLTLEEVAQQTKLSKSALSQYESKDKDISHTAIAALARFYGVSGDYLMGLSENKNHPNAELHALHLSDDMIALLQSGTLNNRLLCELVMHPAFRQLLIDIEICVDQIADIRIHDINQLLEATRQTIIEKYHPQEPDLNLRTLELAQSQRKTSSPTSSTKNWMPSSRISAPPTPRISPPRTPKPPLQKSNKCSKKPCLMKAP